MKFASNVVSVFRNHHHQHQHANSASKLEIQQALKKSLIGQNATGRIGIHDFELVRTLGTGMPTSAMIFSLPMTLCSINLDVEVNANFVLLGTFARVWLVRLANPAAKEDRDKVFALKVLRKVDSPFAYHEYHSVLTEMTQ
ncbi:hypothetical protein Golomagni_03559 [Golovinomyces magnicellulatus]|nr:hypothetical protein Golomagni_03559 [Golovinomyces magnicellulatus]